MPNIPAQQVIKSSYLIDKSNSNLADLISLPLELLNYSGTVIMNVTAKSSEVTSYSLGPDQLVGSLELEVPLDLEINNLQFADTVNNFIKDNGNGNNSPVKAENIQLLHINITVNNGFPLGASMKMSLYDSSTNTIKSTVEADDILASAPVDSNGKSTGTTETSTTIELTNEFFSMVNSADKIIFWFTLNTTGNGSQEVKIYSDYRINFTASLEIEPVININ